MAIDTFQEVLATLTASGKKPHLLLGNGFSRACRDDIFAYSALFDRADFGGLSPFARGAFEALNTQDFEIVMEALRNASRLATAYGTSDSTLARRMAEDADKLREVLVRAIADSHPASPSEIPDAQFAACRLFLAPFERVYSLNYDLLLYWAYMQQELPPPLKADDGFRASDDGTADYVVWEPSESNRQTLYFVHGGLHLFDSGSELAKFTWSKTGVRLVDQIRAALSQQRYPLFVAEGSSKQKLTRIRHHAYLAKAERSLTEISGTLVVFGMSFGEGDSHIMTWIAKSKVERVCVSLFGDPASETNLGIRTSIQNMIARRKGSRQLTVSYFDAASANVWGKT